MRTIRSLEQTLRPDYVCGYALTLLFTMNASVVQDFLQVLSMFAGFNFEWPPAVKGIFNVLSVANFNVNLVAPECSVALSYETKWWVTSVSLIAFRLCGHTFQGSNQERVRRQAAPLVCGIKGGRG